MDPERQHVSLVGTGKWPMFTKTWTVSEVGSAIAAGDRFFMKIGEGNEKFPIRYVVCPGCQQVATLESTSKASDFSALPRLH
jgi:hypothetical protein